MLSERVMGISPSATISLNAKAKELAKRGEKVFNFTVGEPDFNTPENIQNAAIEAIKRNESHYTPSAGIAELRKAIVQKFRRENNIDYAENQIVVSNGAKDSLYNISMALLNPGDEVIIPKPAWVSFKEQVKMAGGKPVFVETDEKFRPIPEEIAKAAKKKTKYLILNYPSNPTGATLSKNDLKRIADAALEKNFIVVSDEVYEHFLYDGKTHTSFASLSEEVKDITITVNAVSKSYAMTGWRVGFLACRTEISNAISDMQSHSISAPCSIAQWAAVEALNGKQESVGKMLQEFDSRRKYVFRHLNEIDGIKCTEPEGAFYVFPNIEGTFNRKIKDSVAFCEKMLDEARVALVPGEAFEAPGFVRISFAASIEDLKAGIERIKETVKKMK